MRDRKKLKALKSLLRMAQEAEEWGMVLYYRVVLEAYDSNF